MFWYFWDTVNYCSVSRPVWASDSFYDPLNRHHHVITESHLQHRSIDRALTAFYLRVVQTQWIQTPSDYISSIGDKLLNRWMLSNWRNSNPDLFHLALFIDFIIKSETEKALVQFWSLLQKAPNTKSTWNIKSTWYYW